VHLQDRIRDKRSRHTFWIDDRIVDEFGPVMGQYPTGPTALAVYAVLARRADRDGESWPRMRSIAEQVGTSPRSVQRAVRLLEALGLLEVATCHEQGTNRQTSNLYTLLTPPDPLPGIDSDPEKWPLKERKRLVVRGGNRAQAVADAREQEWLQVVGPPVPPCQGDTPSPASVAAPPRQGDTPSPASVAGREGNTNEGNPAKEGAHGVGLSRNATFTIEEVGLSNRQVWVAALEEVARRGDVGRAELETWLRPAGLIGRKGDTLIVGAPNSVARDRIASRLLPALREALGLTVGAKLELSIVVDGG
jgi:DNA-binding transcriptional ArsR family regulator